MKTADLGNHPGRQSNLTSRIQYLVIFSLALVFTELEKSCSLFNVLFNQFNFIF